jgi:protein-S-isoprenylcysteine O-methyltransferase Ste14
MFGAARVAPGLSYHLPYRFILSQALAALGGSIAFAGVLAFRGQRTTVNPLTPGASSSVVTAGVYRLSRNPMYLGFFFALAGWALFLSNVGSLVLLPGFLAYLTQFQIKPEERALLEKFGPEFEQYMTRVRRWL